MGFRGVRFQVSGVRGQETKGSTEKLEAQNPCLARFETMKKKNLETEDIPNMA